MPNDDLIGKNTSLSYFTNWNEREPYSNMAKPLTIEALQDALTRLEKLRDGQPLTIRHPNPTIVLHPKMYKSYQRRHKRKRNRDRYLLVTPWKSFYIRDRAEIKRTGC